jgi:hypothetical protein
MPLHQVEALPLRDYLAYEAYAAHRMFPLQRMEFLLARIAMLIDAGRLPGQTLSLNDYLINPIAKTPGAEKTPAREATDEEADAIAEAMGFEPRQPNRSPQDQQPAP